MGSRSSSAWGQARTLAAFSKCARLHGCRHGTEVVRIPVSTPFEARFGAPYATRAPAVTSAQRFAAPERAVFAQKLRISAYDLPEVSIQQAAATAG